MEQYTNADMLGVFLTGSAVDWAPAVAIGEVGYAAPPFKFADEPSDVDPDDSLGGFRAPNRVEQLGFF